MQLTRREVIQAAFVGAALAGRRALLTVLHPVLGAFVTARLADLCARRAYGFCGFTGPGHCGRRYSADVGAVDVERNAPRHHLDVLFLEAGRGAVVAGFSAFVASPNAIGEFLVRHCDVLRWCS